MVGERLKKLRKRLGLTQKQFARGVSGKVDYTYIGKIERGHQYPSLKMLERIGRAFSVPLSYFFEDDSFLKSFDLLPAEIKDLLKDKKRQHLLRMSRQLKKRDLDVLIEITNVLLHQREAEILPALLPFCDYPMIAGCRR